MTAMIFSLTPEVREAALDMRAIRRKVNESRDRGYEWMPAEANARRRMIALSRERYEKREPTSGAVPPGSETGKGS
jgi:hypothetical protein